MTPSRPYLIRALNEWILDNRNTPYILVDAGMTGVEVPQEYVTDGQIVLNIAPGAVKNLSLDNEAVAFNARFGGVPMTVYVPVTAIMAIYARETGQGMSFGREPGTPEPPPPGGEGPSDSKGRGREQRPSLKVVK